MYHRRCFLALVFVLSAAGLAVGQDETPKFRFGVEPLATPEDLQEINLRPNTATNIGVWLQNPREEAIKDAVVKLVQVVGARVDVISQIKIANLKARDQVRLAFPPAKNAVELIGPPFALQLWLEENKKPEPTKLIVPVKIRSPRDFVTVTEAVYDQATRRISFKVKLNRDYVGPANCPVQLVLDPEMNPGLIPSKAGTFKQVLTDPNQTAELFADLDFDPDSKSLDDNRVTLTVDGVDRAFTYTVTYKEKGGLKDVDFSDKPGVRLVAPRYAAPTPKFLAPLQIDAPLDRPYRVELGLNRAPNPVLEKQSYQITTYPATRDLKIKVGIAPTGDLICTTSVKDWQATLDTAEVYGPIELRLRVLQPDGKPLQLKEENSALFQKNVANRANLTLRDDRLLADIILDATPPENVKFVDLPKEWIKGKPLELKAAVKNRDPRKNAPLERVYFLRGKVPFDAKFAPEIILNEAVYDPKTGLWKAGIATPEMADKMEVSVHAVTKLGLLGDAFGKVTLVDPPMPKEKKPDEKKPKLAKITGVIMHGPRAQPNLAVTLYDAKGEVKGAVKTNEGGVYAFEKVTPGNYFVAAVKGTPALTATIRVEVPEGKELVDKQDLALKAK